MAASITPGAIDAYFQAPSSVFLCPTEKMNVSTPGWWEIMDRDSWEHCLQKQHGELCLPGQLTCTFDYAAVKNKAIDICSMGDN